MALLPRCLAEMRSKHWETDDEMEWLGHEEVFLCRAADLLSRDQSDGIHIPEQRRSAVTTVASSTRATSRWPKLLYNGRWSLHEEDPVRGITTVIHIEADHANALLMRCLLASRTNYVLHHAMDGNGGLELCRQVNPDLVITEMHLPDMTAYDVLRALRDDGATDGVPCVVFSADAIQSQIKRALAIGFEDYWTKPIDIWQLMQKIEDAATSACCKRSRQNHISKSTFITTLPSRGADFPAE